ncbi:MAG: glycosyltransferase family 4 protein [Verrucomicrobia subdivision 3 bacterium]|nr:glycosyltransferase family 4 protein [Limisphaerales bacterium]
MDALADFAAAFQRLVGRSGTKITDESFQRVDHLARRQVDPSVLAVIAREDACLQSFKVARQFGIPTIYQLPTAFYQFVRCRMKEEASHFPGIICEEEVAHEFAPERCERKETELAHADYVLCPSEFVRKSLPETPALQGRVITIPLGIDVESWNPVQGYKQPVFLYVGNITIRKGAHRLLTVWKKLKAYRTHQLKLIGDMGIPRSFLSDFVGMYDFVPRVHRRELQRHYQAAQAFVFNAMADGFGHVFAEAMACGTAVLCSRNTGAPDLVTDGVEGRLFDYGDDDQLAATLDWALTHPTELREMGVAARRKALRCGWNEFETAFLHWFHSITSGSASTPTDSGNALTGVLKPA